MCSHQWSKQLDYLCTLTQLKTKYICTAEQYLLISPRTYFPPRMEVSEVQNKLIVIQICHLRFPYKNLISTATP